MRALERIRLAWSSGAGLEIRASDQRPGDDCVPLPPVPGVVAAVCPAPGSPSPLTPTLAYDPDDGGLFEPLHLRENATYHLFITVPVGQAEAAARARVRDRSDAWPFVNGRLADVITFHPEETWRAVATPTGEGTVIYASADFGSFVGVVDLTVAGGGPCRVEVASLKIDYFDDFKTLLAGVAEDVLDLLFQVDSVAGLRFAAAAAQEVPPAVVLFHLRDLMGDEQVPAAVEAVIQNPHARLEDDVRLTPSAHAADVDAEYLAARAAELDYESGGPLAGVFQGYSPLALIERRRHDSVDTPENRFVKNFLEELAELCTSVQRRLERERKHASVREVRGWYAVVEDLLSAELWRDVGPMTHLPSNSQVLLRRPAYREIVQADLILREGVVLPWQRVADIAETLGDIRPIFELYEYWCFFRLRALLRELCGPEAQQLENFYVRKDNELTVDVRRGKGSRLRFHYAGQKALQVDLFYNRTFRRPGVTAVYGDNSYSATFRPDFSVRVAGAGVTHWLHLDAKYRLDLKAWQEQLEASAIDTIEDDLSVDQAPPEDRALYKKADLYKMHAYRDALIGSRGAYVLFPATAAEASLYVRHAEPAYRRTYELPSVGAFPLHPNGSAPQLQQLRDFFGNVLALIGDSSVGYSDDEGFVV